MNPPKPFPNKNQPLKAFVLGCDPTAIPVENGPHLIFEYVFDLNKDPRYFAGIKVNLEILGITVDQVYVQNLIPDYLDKESSKNRDWLKTAAKFVDSRREEFNKVDPSGKVPVFLTSELLYKALLNDPKNYHKAAEIYKLTFEPVIDSSENKLARPLIPLYRHPSYSLKNQTAFAERIKLEF